MKYYILTDLEGAAGVTDFAGWCMHDSPRYDLARQLLSEELNACARGICSADAQAEIVAWDGHGGGGLEVQALDASVQLIPRGPVGPTLGMDQGFDAAFFLAQHARAGTPRANMSHSYSYENHDAMWLNGVEVGEMGFRAAALGALGVPVIWVSGDDCACAEAGELIPGITTAVVKKAIDREVAQTMSPAGAQRLIERTAAQAVGKIGNIVPLRFDPPYSMRIRFTRDDLVDTIPTRGRVEVEDSRTVTIHADNLFDFPL